MPKILYAHAEGVPDDDLGVALGCMPETEYHKAVDARSLFRRIHAEKYDVIALDMDLPESSEEMKSSQVPVGPQLISDIRQRGENIETPIVALHWGTANRSLEERARSAGATDYVEMSSSTSAYECIRGAALRHR